ncbi:MAG: ROK family protein [Candidatus Woesearchaeota archaeon]|nr:ROK family protein [Candidatus Woesearchaeota archaeon]
MKIIGVDVGASKIAAGLVINGKVAKKYVCATNKKNKGALIEGIINSIEKVYNKNVKGIGIGLPGAVNEKGFWLESSNIPCVKDINIKRIMEKRFKKEVRVNNDAKCFTLAEHLFGNGKGKKNILGIIVGTGVGSGIVINGKLHSGKNLLAGEIGMIRYKGQKIEKFCSAAFIKNLAKKYNIRGTPTEISAFARKGNKKAKKIFSLLGRNIGYLISIAINLLDPDIIILGGGVSNSFGLFAKEMKKSVNENLFYSKAKKTKIVKSGLKDAGILGAAGLFYR